MEPLVVGVGPPVVELQLSTEQLLPTFSGKRQRQGLEGMSVHVDWVSACGLGH